MYLYVHVHVGEVYTFGKHAEGQLGRSSSTDDPGEEAVKGENSKENETWYLTPGPIPSLGDGCKVVWVGARGNQTFVAVNESLVSDQNLGKCHVFADLHTIGEYSYCTLWCVYSLVGR